MKTWLTKMAAKVVGKLGTAPSAPRPRRAGLAVEALEDRLVPSGIWGWDDPPSNPWSYTVPSGHGSDTIAVSVANGQLKVLDNGTPVPGTPLSLTGVTSITLTGGTNTTNTFVIQSTPAGIPMTVNFATDWDTATVGYAGSVQGVRGNVGFNGYDGLGQVTVDDSADTTSHSATLYNGALGGLAPASIFANNLPSVLVKGNAPAGDAISIADAHSSGNEFVGFPGKSTLWTDNENCNLEVDNFAKVVAIGNTPGDSATLHGSTAGANTLTARYAATTLSGPGYSLEVDYFGHAYAYGATSRDVATIYGLSGYCNDLHAGVGSDGVVGGELYSIGSTSLGDTESASLWPISSYAYYRLAQGFQGLTVNAGSANDIATLGAAFSVPCNFVGLANSSFLCGTGWAIQANSFAQLTAEGTTSGKSLMVSTPGDSTSYGGGPQGGTFLTTPAGYVEALGFGSYQHSAYSDLASEAQALNTLLTSLATYNAFPGTYSLTLTQPGSTATQKIAW
jgi:hypothetical protein